MTEFRRGIGLDLVKYVYIPSTGRLTYAVHIVSPRSERKAKKRKREERVRDFIIITCVEYEEHRGKE